MFVETTGYQLLATETKAERRKDVHYAINCASQIYFIPLAQETLGGWSTQAGKTLSL
jgi:hypothetical protein